MSSAELFQLLPLTGYTPATVQTASGGGYMALALHVYMVENGFNCIGGGSARRGTKGKFVPPEGWDQQYNDEEWLFEYRRKDLSNLIVLHLSLQKESKRLFVQGKELTGPMLPPAGYPPSPQKGGGSNTTDRFFKDRPFKTHNLGLQLPNYVQDPLAAKGASSWEKVFSNMDRCREMFLNHVLVPLITEAQKKPPRGKTAWETLQETLLGSEDGSNPGLLSADGPLVRAASDPRVLVTAGIVVGGAVALGVWWRRQSTAR